MTIDEKYAVIINIDHIDVRENKLLSQSKLQGIYVGIIPFHNLKNSIPFGDIASPLDLHSNSSRKSPFTGIFIEDYPLSITIRRPQYAF